MKNRKELRRDRGQSLTKEEVRHYWTAVDTGTASPTLYHSIPVVCYTDHSSMLHVLPLVNLSST